MLATFVEGTPEFDAALRRLESRGESDFARAEPIVREILDAVRREGDEAVQRYNERFGRRAPHLVVREYPGAAALARLPADVREAMALAATRVRAFHAHEKDVGFRYDEAGITLGVRVLPVSRAGVYAPGGKARYPSSVIMSAVPAQVAGVPEIILATPLAGDESDDIIYAAAYLSGVSAIVDAGGAQAIGALAYGTASVPQVDKIVGPGNLYVTAAKMAVSHHTGVDMPAGPTEIVVASEDGDSTGIAADLVAQAEHDPEALAVFITSKPELALEVVLEVKRQSQGNQVAQQSLAAQGVAFVTKTVEEAHSLTNRLAPEHLTVDTGADLRWVKNAGSIFIGHHTPQSMGDYISGPNHVLPTGRNGRVRGGLSVLDFVKVITVQQYTLDALREVGPHTIALAEAEGLVGHAESVRVRMR